MKKNINRLLVFCVIAFLFSSCGKNNDEGKMIPGNALFVAHIDLNSMNKKLSWAEIRETGWFKKAFSDSSTPEWRKKILESPEESGIDFEKGLIFFAARGEGENFYLVAEGTVKDKDRFEKFNKNFDPEQQVKKTGEINTLILKDKNVVGWSGDHFAYVMNSSTTSSELYNLNNVVSPARFQDESSKLGAYCATLFNLKSDSSLAKNDKFTDLMKEKGDLHFWHNTSEITKSMPDLGMLGMLKLDVFFKDNYGASTVNFEDGKMELTQKYYSGKELTDFLKKNQGSKINSDMVKNIPTQNMLGLFALNFKPGAIQDLIKLTGTDGLANMFLQQSGFSLDDFSKANNGDMVISFSDFSISKDSISSKDNEGNNVDTYGIPKPQFNFLFSMSVKDKAMFQKIVDGLKKLSNGLGEDSSISIQLTDKYFTISNHKNFADQYIKGDQNNKFDFLNNLEGHPLGFYLDIHKMLSVINLDKMQDSSFNEAIDQSLKLWDKAITTSGDIKGDAFITHSEVTLLDQKTNSLKQLNNYLNELYKINELRKERNPDMPNLDSLLTPPLIDTIK